MSAQRLSVTPFELDEGFAEGSQQHGDHAQSNFIAWINTQPTHAKADIAYEILRTLRSTEIAAVVSRLNPLLHMDPVDILPPEITSQIFSYLDAPTLLTASLASSTWRARILDSRLWHDLYHSQGWDVDAKAVQTFEEAYGGVIRNEFRRAGTEIRGASSHRQRPLSKRRATSGWLQSTPRHISADVDGWREQHGVVEADLDPSSSGGDEEMPDVIDQSCLRPNKRQSQDSSDEMEMASDNEVSASTSHKDLMLLDDQGLPSVNWHYLYKQRQLLEQNWAHARYTNFQLPHPEHKSEAHEECVYTIQFHGKWLVSGSRDRSLRIWDLDTKRLRGKPLLGHSQSVLCLQFDPTPEQDVIISGSSDCSIILWRFSTGQKLQQINRAHSESVLNLQFDNRYLVTCSKDKKIKVWNRHTLSPVDSDYPTAKNGPSCQVPAHVLDISRLEPSLLEAGLLDGTYRALKPYSNLMTLDAHAAAVNAIQLYGDTVVSASGDRHIRMWDLKTGTCTKVIIGHEKGIACVQYDGKRVVSGSSDNTIRIFDPISGTEVATLLGHDSLVRTVQAAFGDITGDKIEDLAAARAAEQRLIEDLKVRRTPDDRHYNRRLRNGELGSSRVSIGSNLPPGGGGSKRARIVSGSYDESIIIWKKSTAGDWVPSQILKQDDNMMNRHNNASTTSRIHRNRVRTRHSDNDPHTAHHNESSQQQTALNAHDDTAFDTNTATLPAGDNRMPTAHQIMQDAMHTSITSIQTSISGIADLNRISNNTYPGANSITRAAIQDAVGQIAASVQTAAQSAVRAAITSAIANDLSLSNSSAHTANSHVPVVLLQPQSQPTAPPRQTLNAAGRVQRHQTQSSGQSSSRIFKLQFDARRIVCCSQDSRIVGWDFANSIDEIEKCAGFFGGTQF